MNDRGLSQISGVDGLSGVAANFVAPSWSDPMILSAIAQGLKRQSRNNSFGCASYQGRQAHAVPADVR